MNCKHLSAVALTLALVALCLAPASAEALRALPAAASPGQAAVILGSPAKVLSSVHYQAYLPLTCKGNSCGGKLPAPGTRRRLNLTRMICTLVASSDSTSGVVDVVLTENNSILLVAPLPADSAVQGSFLFNSAVDLQVGASQHIAVALGVAGVSAGAAACTASGTLDTLQ